MLHLAATETYYQFNTFDGMKWDSWSADIKKKWDAAMELGDAGRQSIKGHDRDYYVNILHEVREKSLAGSASAMTHGCWLPKRIGHGVRPTITASGSTSASTKHTTPARSPCSKSASPGAKPTAE